MDSQQNSPDGTPVYLVRTELRTIVCERPAIRAPRDAAEIFSREIGNKDREHVLALHLDAQHRLASMEVISIGSLNSSLVHPREVFKGAILSNAAAVILGHNHPSGDPTPSADDRTVCNGIVAAGRLLDLPVQDFIVVAGERWISFAEAGLL